MTIVEPTIAENDAGTSHRRADIQGLRAVAVGLVVAFHAALPIPGGYVGVDMFFVISGYVIGQMLLRQLRATATLRFGSFYTRRLRRLLPALALLIFTVAAASTVLLSPFGAQQATAHTGIAASLFSANLQLGSVSGAGYFAPVAANALLHTWSLSVEEQFYLAFPAFLLVVWRVAGRLSGPNGRRRAVPILVIVATLASFALSWFATFHPSGFFGLKFAFYSPMTRAWEFGVGVLVAWFSSRLIRIPRSVAVVLGVIGALLIMYCARSFTNATLFPGVAALVPVTGTALLLVSGMVPNWGVSSLLSLRPAVWIGDISYGWYLWHWPLIIFAVALWPGNKMTMVAAALVALVPTLLSYRWIENPIRFNDRIVGRRIIRLVVICVSLPIFACVGLLVINRFESHTKAVHDFAVARERHADSKDECANLTPIGERSPTACTWTVSNPKGTIYLIGDSNAGHFIEVAANAANALGYNLTAATPPGCPMVDVLRPNRGGSSGTAGAACLSFVTKSASALELNPPAMVILAASTQYLEFPEAFRDPQTNQPVATPEGKAQLWEDGTATVLRKLEAAGIPTVLIHSVPHQDAAEFHPENCPAIQIYRSACGFGAVDRASVERQQRATRDAEDRAVAQVPGSVAVDFTDDLCSPRCVLRPS